MDVLSIVLGIGTALGGGGTVFMWLETRGGKRKKHRLAEIDSRVSRAIAPVKTDLQEVRAKVDYDRDHTEAMVREAMHEALAPIREQLTILATRVEPLWKVAEQNIIRNAGVLHQPDPRRYHIDVLLDKLVASVGGGPLLTPGEETELRRLLTLIQNWEPGQDVGFPVHPGEPASAAAILGSMDLVREGRRQGRK